MRSRSYANPGLVVGALLCLAASTTHAQTGALAGTVTDPDGGPVAGAIIQVAGAAPVFSDRDGGFFVSGIALGPVTVLVRAIGYAPLEVQLDLDAGTTRTLAAGALVLTVAPVTLPGVSVTGEAGRHHHLELAGFYDRQRMGLGAFIERAQIERWTPTGTTDILRRTPGVAILPNANRGRRHPRLGMDTRAYIISLRGDRCDPLIFLDGMYLGDARDVDIDVVIPWTHIEAVEIYRGPAEVPMQFRRFNKPCGSLVIWTR